MLKFLITMVKEKKLKLLKFTINKNTEIEFQFKRLTEKKIRLKKIMTQLRSLMFTKMIDTVLSAIGCM